MGKGGRRRERERGTNKEEGLGSRKEALGLRLGVDFGVPSTPRARGASEAQADHGEGREKERRREGNQGRRGGKQKKNCQMSIKVAQK